LELTTEQVRIYQNIVKVIDKSGIPTRIVVKSEDVLEGEMYVRDITVSYKDMLVETLRDKERENEKYEKYKKTEERLKEESDKI